MAKYQIIIQFSMDDEFMNLVPPHRTYINYLINNDTIDQYAVSMETRQVWITMTAENREAVKRMLEKSPLYRYWTYDIAELFVVDGQLYRLPAMQPN